MKFLICVIAALTVLQNVRGDSAETEKRLGRSNIKMLRHSFFNRPSLEPLKNKIDGICPGYGNQLENVTMEIETCLASIDEKQETLCSLVRNYVKRCINPFTSLLKECLPTQTKQIPAMFIDMIVTSIDYLCKADGEHIFELGNACIRNSNIETDKCMRRLFTQFQKYQRLENLPSAADVCDLYESVRPCFQSHVVSACNNQITKEFYMDLYDVSLKVCKKYKSNDVAVVDVSAD